MQQQFLIKVDNATGTRYGASFLSSLDDWPALVKPTLFLLSCFGKLLLAPVTPLRPARRSPLIVDFLLQNTLFFIMPSLLFVDGVQCFSFIREWRREGFNYACFSLGWNYSFPRACLLFWELELIFSERQKFRSRLIVRVWIALLSVPCFYY